MKIGFHYHIPAYLNSEGGIVTAGFFGVFIDSLAKRCTELTCFLHTPLKSECKGLEYIIRSANVKFFELGIHESVPLRLIHANQHIEKVKEEILDQDVFLVRAPTPLLNSLYKATDKNVPFSLLIVGDYVASAKVLHTPFLKKQLIKLHSYINSKQQKKIAKSSMVFVNSRLLFDQYRGKTKFLFEVKTTTLNEKDFYLRDDTCQKHPLQLLYTGRIDLAKGLLEMVEALSVLNKKKALFKLNFVGWEEGEGDPIKKKIKLFANSLNVGRDIIFHGKKNIGNELNSMYRSADIYLIPSKGSEGFPRTIWEAMANSLPVIASHIGSIPHFLTDKEDVLLVKPGDYLDIVKKVTYLVNHEEMRKKLIKNGLAVAKENTLDRQAIKIIENLEYYIRP